MWKLKNASISSHHPVRIRVLECRQDRSAERVQCSPPLHEDRVPGSWLGHSVSPWGRKREGAQTEERRQQPQQVSDRDRLLGERRKRGRLACLRGGLAQAAASWWEEGGWGGEWIGYRRRWRASALLCATAFWMADSSFLAADRFPSADSDLCQFGALTCLFANPPLMWLVAQLTFTKPNEFRYSIAKQDCF